jgi:predicted anti-sigma-YlaC factor YlaD
VTELTTDYLERSMPLARRMAMKLHLAICLLCRRHLLHVAQTVELLRCIPPVETPPTTEDHLIALLVAAVPGRDIAPGE